MADTLSDAEIARTLRLAPDDLEALARTIAQRPRSTLEPAPKGSAGERALLALGSEDRVVLAGLDVEGTIGEGGMGIVHLATQRSLGRKVAVKTLRALAKKDPRATLRLLREAWVTGMLEHPNIVPVYDVGLDDAGAPVIVLKRIEGVAWDAVIRDRPLEENLRTLLQICNAVSLAHARGVLHRDLKPENVMIGSFGEVYLVDWGIAVSLFPDPTGRLPLAAEQKELAGTPCYMAPEMLGGGELSERTDGYLLGAILHEILTGAPPHDGSFQKVVASILLSQPTYPAEAPRELVAIARRAMARDARERWPSVAALKERLEWYLAHRGSLAISAAAAARLDALRRLAGSATAPPDAVYRLLAECRFGFRQALDASSENAEARAGLHETLALVIRFELARGGAEAADGLLAELDDPPPDLAIAVAEARARRAEDRARMTALEAQAAQLDPATGRRTRVAVAAACGVLWTVSPQLAGPWYERQPVHPWWGLHVMTVGLFGLSFLGVIWGRESLMRTQVNRRVVATGTLVFAMQLALERGCSLLGLPWHVQVTLHLVVWALGAATLGLLVDRRFWLAAIAYVAAFLVAAGAPAHLYDAMSGGNFALLVIFLVAWWRPVEDFSGGRR